MLKRIKMSHAENIKQDIEEKLPNKKGALGVRMRCSMRLESLWMLDVYV